MNVLKRWYAGYRAWEDGFIAMLDALDSGRAVDPAWIRSPGRRRLVDRVRCGTPGERTQMRDFIWRFRGWRGWAAIASLVAVDCVVGWVVSVALPAKFGALEAMALVNLLVLSLGLGIVTTWFHPGRFARYGGRALIVVPALAVAGALVGATIAAVAGGKDPMAVLQRIGKDVLVAGLVFGIVYGGLLGLIVAFRNRELRALNAQLVAGAEKARLATQLTESKLRLLRAQIEPHFLFNTLGAVQQLAEQRAPEAAALTAHLIRFLRSSVNGFDDDATTLGDEAQVIDSYLQIMQSRLGARLVYAIDIPDALRRCRIQPTILLTFVENAIKHGIEGAPCGGTIHVRASASPTTITVDVADTGAGLGDAIGDGHGLRNAREQLALAYEDRASLELIENEPTGLIVRVCIPREEHVA